MSKISRAGRSELVRIIAGWDRCEAQVDEPAAGSLHDALASGSVEVRDQRLCEAMLHEPKVIEEALLLAAKENARVDVAFILFGLRVLFEVEDKWTMRRIEHLLAA